MNPDTIQLNEALYTVINVVGFVVSTRNLRLYWGDIQVLTQQKTNGARKALAWDTWRNEFGRAITMFGLILIGLGAMTAPVSPNSWLRLLSTVVFFLVALYFSICSILTAQAREVVIRDLEKQRQARIKNIAREPDEPPVIGERYESPY